MDHLTQQLKWCLGQKTQASGGYEYPVTIQKRLEMHKNKKDKDIIQ